MRGFRFHTFKGKDKSQFDALFDIFKQLVTHTSGDVEEALDWLRELDKEYELTTKEYTIDDFINELKERGYLRDKTDNTGGMAITAKTEQAIRTQALERIFGKLKRGGAGNHKTGFTGKNGEEASDELRAYEFGDAPQSIAMMESIQQAQQNHGIDNFSLTESDLLVRETEFKTQTATVLMIDISHSMILYGEDRITPAKLVAMALSEMITQKYPKDSLDIIVFGNDAWPIQVKDLPYLQVGPYHTNTVAGLELAMAILKKKKTANKQIFMITDGKPSCLKENGQYYKNSFGLDRMIVNKCINLAVQCKRSKIDITTFMVANDSYLQDFVDEFTEANQGKAYFTGLKGLGEMIFRDYTTNKRKKSLKQMMSQPTIKTLGELKKSGYISKSIKDELRDNLIARLKTNEAIFTEIFGYEETVIPELKRAILSKHNINFLGLRGQAKTKMARQLTQLLDEYMPVVSGSILNDDPLQPISHYAKQLIADKKDDTPISWIHRNDRYAEKLATPDVSVADLIGDIDPIKAVNLKVSMANEEVIHYGLIPRSNRFIFVINELPDLQARIQVALFNILQEGDVQIRGFNIRIPLDTLFIFTANPEDYTNRGSIVTPLKDRIGSQILTHYLSTTELARKITESQARLSTEQKQIEVSYLLKDLVEQIAMEARVSEYVDAKSGVSSRLTISAYESLVSAAELRFLSHNQKYSFARVLDVYATTPAINGKIELVYEGEQEGAAVVAQMLIGKAIRSLFVKLFPDPSLLKKKKAVNPYEDIIAWFANDQQVDLLDTASDKTYTAALSIIDGLEELVNVYHPNVKGNDKLVLMEFVLHGLAEHSLLSKNVLVKGVQFKDLFNSLMGKSNDRSMGEE